MIKDALIKNQDKNNNRLTLNIVDDQQKEWSLDFGDRIMDWGSNLLWLIN
jgi:hypothetical protein